MHKGRLHIALSQSALDELARRSKAAGMTRQAYIEDWLKGLDHEPLAETPDTIAKLEAAIAFEPPPVTIVGTSRPPLVRTFARPPLERTFGGPIPKPKDRKR